ncbi:MAG: dihydroorotate dehydrogenase-like protein [Candidatus Omnitrophica bacterium]|nr:dihydroorotate dehydrogenase-like protein [Candidatus Omnitrophota bacterium]
MPDLSTDYLGMTLTSPLVVSAGPMCESLDAIRQMEDEGAGAVVLHSLFEEQILVESDDLDRQLSAGTNSFAEAMDYFPDQGIYRMGPEAYLEHISRAKAAVDIPVIASLNGVSAGGWVKYSKLIQEAGADGLELNIYFIPTDTDQTATQVEANYLAIVDAIKKEITLPVAVKLNPFFTSLPNFAKRLDEAGADAMVLFNRFYQPDFDLDTLEVVTKLRMSSSYELLTRLHWIAILFGKVKADLALTGGAHTGEDVLKSMMAGARVAMMTSALLERGLNHLSRVKAQIELWMEEHEYESIRQMQGSMSLRSIANPSAYQRANYMKVLRTAALHNWPEESGGRL